MIIYESLPCKFIILDFCKWIFELGSSIHSDTGSLIRVEALLGSWRWRSVRFSR